MAAKEISFRFFGFLIPWIAFSLVQYYLLQITQPYALMMYGGAAAILCLSVRDSLLDMVDKDLNDKTQKSR